MTGKQQKSTVFAPAKINLYLHVTGRRDDGYHTLDTLVCFADIGDTITIEPAKAFSFAIEGPFAAHFTAQEKEAGRHSANLVPRAAWALADAAGKNPALRITLIKNIPLGAGLGGGSGDAAAALWALAEYWGLPAHPEYLNPLMLKLGSDVPACYRCEPVRVRGIGEILSPAPEAIPELSVLLVHPGKACSTAAVYTALPSQAHRPDAQLPSRFESAAHFLEFLSSTQNVMTDTAIALVPEIENVLSTLTLCDKALISRMSGSGSACFALFEREEDCLNAAEKIVREHPRWWVRAGTIGRTARY